MPCLFFVLGAGAPRLVLALLWLLSSWFSAAYGTWVIPVLGFLFAPLSTIWYAVVQHYFGGRVDAVAARGYGVGHRD